MGMVETGPRARKKALRGGAGGAGAAGSAAQGRQDRGGGRGRSYAQNRRQEALRFRIGPVAAGCSGESVASRSRMSHR